MIGDHEYKFHKATVIKNNSSCLQDFYSDYFHCLHIRLIQKCDGGGGKQEDQDELKRERKKNRENGVNGVDGNVCRSSHNAEEIKTAIPHTSLFCAVLFYMYVP